MAQYLKARPTVYNGIQMRSRMEARVAARFDEWLVEWQYEPKCYASGGTQYLPDFLITAGVFLPRVGNVMGGRIAAPLFIETKPIYFPWDERLTTMRRMEVIWESVPKAILLYVVVDEPDEFFAEHRGMDGVLTGSITGPGMKWRGGALGRCTGCGWPRLSISPAEEHCDASCSDFTEWAEERARPMQSWLVP